MNMETVSGAAIAALISFGNALLALFMNDTEMTLGMVSQAAWIGMVVGASVQFLKDYQALSTRRVIGKMTHRGDGSR